MADNKEIVQLSAVNTDSYCNSYVLPKKSNFSSFIKCDGLKSCFRKIVTTRKSDEENCLDGQTLPVLSLSFYMVIMCDSTQKQCYDLAKKLVLKNIAGECSWFHGYASII